MERMFIDDKSGDRKYFTMVPNIVIAKSNANEKALYLEMKMIAGEDGVCWAGTRELARRLSIDRGTVRKAMKELLARGWISFIGDRNIITAGGRQAVHCYRIMDIWRQNVLYFKGGCQTDHLGSGVGVKPARGGCQTAQGGCQTRHNKIPKNIKKGEVLNFGENIPDPEEARDLIKKLREGINEAR
jgi:DNA-binding transcriptional MocR family regulator